MNLIKNKLKVYAITAFVFTIIATILHTIMLFMFFDKDIGYFQSNLFTSIAVSFAVCVSVWFFTILIFIPKKTMQKEMPKDSLLLRSSFTICAFMNAFALLYIVFNIAKDIKNNELITKAPMILLLFIVLSILYFIGKTFRVFKIDTTVFFGFFVVLTSATLLAEMYFDNSVQMNNPLKITMQISLLLIMLFYLGDFRFDLKKPLPRLYFIIGLLAFFACTATSLPHIIAFFADTLDNTDYLAKNIYIFINGLYILARTSLYLKHNFIESDEPSIITETAI